MTEKIGSENNHYRRAASEKGRASRGPWNFRKRDMQVAVEAVVAAGVDPAWMPSSTEGLK